VNVMADPANIWTDYPPELLAEADANRAAAEAALLTATPIDPDPYNVSLSVLLKRWWTRKRQG
jgi:hypothetical protein